MALERRSHETEPQRLQEDDELTAALLAAIMAVMMVGFYHVSRIGLQHSEDRALLKILSLGLFLFMFPAVTRLMYRRICKTSPVSWLGSEAALSLLGLGVAVTAGLATAYVHVNLASLFCIAGVVSFLAVVVVWWSRCSARANLTFAAIAAVFGLWALACIYGSNYHNPLFVEALVAGRAHLDELIVAATTAMIKTYGVPSTGLDGIPYYHYHWGSWWIFAQLSRLLDVPSLTFIQAGFPAIFGPMLVTSMLGFSREVHARLFPHTTAPRLRTDRLFWFVLAAALIGFVPADVSRYIMLSLPISESYTVSLYFFFHILALALYLANCAGSTPTRPNLAQYVLLFPVLPILLAVACVIKVSTGFVLGALSGYVFLRCGLFRSLAFTVSLGSAAVGTILTTRYALSVTNLSSPGPLLSPLHFLLHDTPGWLRPFFYPVHWFWALVCGCAFLYIWNIRSLPSLRDAVRSKRTVPLEVLAVACLAGAAPGMAIAIGGGSAFFFSHVQVWLAVGLLLGSLNAVKDALRTEHHETASSCECVGLKRGPVRYAAMAIVVLVIAGMTTRVTKDLAYAVYRNVSTRLCLCSGEQIRSNDEVGCHGKEWAVDFARDVRMAVLGHGSITLAQVLNQDLDRLRVSVQSGLDRNPRYHLVTRLRGLQKLPLKERRQTLLFIPQANDLYWGLIDVNVIGAFDYPACKSIPFVAPALAEMAMIDGLPSPDCDLYSFGYYAYEKRVRPQTEIDTEPETVCSRARSKGFFHVIGLGMEKRDLLKTGTLACSED